MTSLPLPLICGKTTLRPLSEKDLAAWYALEADAEVKRYIKGAELRPQTEWITEARRLLPKIRTLAVIETASGRFAGRASLDYEAPWEVVVVIAKRYWGCGFGRDVSNTLIDAAFRYYHADYVTTVVHPENRASLRLVEELGFHYVRKRSSPGDWQDGHLVFQLLRSASSPVFTASSSQTGRPGGKGGAPPLASGRRRPCQ